MITISSEFLVTILKRFRLYKDLGDKTFLQLAEKDFHFQPNESSNSIAIIIQHLHGNMLSRWTNFLTEDGDKEWRDRDWEFEVHDLSKDQLLDFWEKGWTCTFDALGPLREEDLGKIIYIRSEGLSVLDAILRQFAHYAYHVGQVVYLGRLLKDQEWKSLSIPKGASEAYKKSMNKIAK